MGNRVATLLGHLLANLMRDLLALRVSHRSTNFVRLLPAFGGWVLSALDNSQPFTFLLR